MDVYENLSNAIVIQAAENYASAFMGSSIDGKKPDEVMRECEQFFHSAWYARLTSIDGEWLARKVKIRELDKAIKTYDVILKSLKYTTFRATVNFPKKKGEEKKGPLKYIFPPRLAKDFYDVLRIQLEDLKAEKKALESGANESEVKE